MIKRIIIILLLCLLGNSYTGLKAAQTLINTSELSLLDELSGRNFIFSSAIPEDSLIRLCVRLESQAINANDFDTYFKIGQLKVNAYCRKGDIGVAISEAKNLYERAKTLNSGLGIALSLQAIGNTYMDYEQPEQAFKTFVEAEKHLRLQKAAPLLLIRLYLQMIHVCTLQKDMPGMRTYLNRLSGVIQQNKAVIQEKAALYDYYACYKLCYEVLYQIGVKNTKEATLLLEQLKKDVNATTQYKRWYYWVMLRYYELNKDYTTAIIFTDSVLEETKGDNKNLNEYCNALIDKASLLEKMEDNAEACKVYKEIRELTNQLDIQRYARQIEHLHAAYLVDQLEVDNEAAHKSLYTWIIISCTVILLGSIAIFLMVRQKNKMLVASRNKLQVIQEETAHSIQSKSMFLSNMSHELRTPLNAIVGFSGILTSCSEIDSETKQQCSESIQQNADLLLKLIKDVMDFSEMNTSEIRYTCNTYNVVSICRMVVDTVEKVKQTSATVKFVPSVEELSLYTDSGRLQQVLINLLINATKFTKAGTITLYLTVDKENETAVFTVEDTGCGIPLEKQPRIFERFEKLHEGIQGSGLGLSICQLIVEHFGGKIWIDSSYTAGARFIFTHPLPSPNNTVV